ncbi:MAG: response regulator [Nitrospiraceae bacterium]|nr:response regulator [Nitrospiraceae bacterium]
MTCKAEVLVVEDDNDLRGVLSSLLESGGYHVSAVSNGRAALERARKCPPDAAVIDIVMPGLSGIDTIHGVRKLCERTQIVVLTGHPSLETAVGALREGVSDYLLKPGGIGKLVETVERVLEKGARTAQEASPAPDVHQGGGPILLGRSPTMQKVRRLIHQVAPSGMTVLLRGETGTGKDVAAQLIHALSGRARRGIFCKVNCLAVPENLWESEMFGYERGAFTGAERPRPGRFELASLGTIFLDEVGTMLPTLQAKLLEVIESKSFFRVGGTEKVEVDMRIVAATNAPLEQEVNAGAFRTDLLYRLQHFVIFMPSLRERTGDIPLLAEHFCTKYAREYERAPQPLSTGARARLLSYSWPGNVRELASVMARYVLTGSVTIIDEEASAATIPAASHDGLNVLEHSEAQAITDTLARTGWNQRQAAKLLGLSYSALRRRIAKYAVARPGWVSPVQANSEANLTFCK